MNPVQVAICQNACTPGDSNICCSFLPGRALLIYVDEVECWQIKKRDMENWNNLFRFVPWILRDTLIYNHASCVLSHCLSAWFSSHVGLYLLHHKNDNMVLSVNAAFLNRLVLSVPKGSETRQPALCRFSQASSHTNLHPLPGASTAMLQTTRQSQRRQINKKINK